MAIKSKKWKNRIVFLVFFIGISMLMAGIGRFAYESYSVGVDEVCAEPVSYTHLTLPTTERV